MKLFVIFNYGLDYNDETHEIGGEGAEVLKTGFTTLEDAKEALEARLKEQVSNFSINDFGWESSYEYPFATNWLQELTNSDQHYCSYSYRDKVGCIKEHNWGAFIRYCEANDISWLDKVPQLLCIQEITV